MTKENLTWLTKEVYRLTLLFPKKEPLRYKMRELADDILANSLRIIYSVRNQGFSNGANFREYTNTDNQSKGTENVSRQFTEVGPMADLEVLDGFFEVAKEQNWVKPDHILAIQKEYANLREELERGKLENSLAEATLPLIPVAAAAATFPAGAMPSELKNNFILLDNERINERQERILAFLREQGRAQVWQLKQVLPEVTKRTLRRDFENLLKKGVIERVGERNNTFYQLKIVQV